MSNAVTIHQHAMGDMERIARAISASKLFGVQSAEQALALCLIAQAEGRHPASAAQDYHIVNNRPTKKADAMLRDFIAGGGAVKWAKLTDTEAEATFSHPQGGTVTLTWDIARATTAGLMGNAMWKKYPRQMLRARTVSEGVRTVYPLATSGFYVPEEAADIEPEPINITPAPKPATPAPKAPLTGTAGKAQKAMARVQDEPAQDDRWADYDGPAQEEDEAFADAMCEAFGDCASLDDLGNFWREKAGMVKGLKERAADLYTRVLAAKDARKAELEAG